MLELKLLHISKMGLLAVNAINSGYNVIQYIILISKIILLIW